MEYYRSMGLYMSAMEFTTGVLQVLVIAVGGLLIMAGKMDYVDLITFTLYVSTFISPLRRLIQLISPKSNKEGSCTLLPI